MDSLCVSDKGTLRMSTIAVYPYSLSVSGRCSGGRLYCGLTCITCRVISNWLRFSLWKCSVLFRTRSCTRYTGIKLFNGSLTRELPLAPGHDLGDLDLRRRRSRWVVGSTLAVRAPVSERRHPQLHGAGDARRGGAFGPLAMPPREQCCGLIFSIICNTTHHLSK